MQSGHGSGHDVPVWEWIARDYALKPSKPTLDLEPNYEDHPFNPWPRWDPATGYFRDLDVRKQVYRSVFAGGCGVTYGHHAVWGFVGKRNDVINFADRDWIDGLQRPAGRQMISLRALMESRPFFTRMPDQSLIAGEAGTGRRPPASYSRRQRQLCFCLFSFERLGGQVEFDKAAGSASSRVVVRPANGGGNADRAGRCNASSRIPVPAVWSGLGSGAGRSGGGVRSSRAQTVSRLKNLTIRTVYLLYQLMGLAGNLP